MVCLILCCQNYNTLDTISLMNHWKVCYPKGLDSLMNLHTAVIICIDSPSLWWWFLFSSNCGMIQTWLPLNFILTYIVWDEYVEGKLETSLLLKRNLLPSGKCKIMKINRWWLDRLWMYSGMAKIIGNALWGEVVGTRFHIHVCLGCLVVPGEY